MNTLIQATQLSKSFGSKKVLQNIDFEIKSGEPVALIGPNGAGKTTLFSIMCGYMQPSAGSISILGHAAGSAALAGRVSALPQDAQFDPSFSVLTQLSFYAQLQGMAKAQAKQEATRVLKLVDLGDQLNQKATALSHGMRKRAAIAQALLGQPELVLLDEPTAGLDPVNALQVRQLISGLSDQATFIISSHNIFELERLCGTILYLEHGQLKQQRQVQHISAIGTLSLQLDGADSSQVLAAIQNMAGVSSVKQTQKNEYLLQYNAEIAVDLDLRLLTLLQQQGWSYRQLTKGQTLEQQLFAVANG